MASRSQSPKKANSGILKQAGYVVSKYSSSVQTESSFLPSTVSFTESMDNVKIEAWEQLKDVKDKVVEIMTEFYGSIHDLMAWKDILVELSQIPSGPLTDVVLISAKLFRRCSDLSRALSVMFGLVFAESTADTNYHFVELSITQAELVRMTDRVNEIKDELTQAFEDIQKLKDLGEESVKEYHTISKDKLAIKMDIVDQENNMQGLMDTIAKGLLDFSSTQSDGLKSEVDTTEDYIKQSRVYVQNMRNLEAKLIRLDAQFSQYSDAHIKSCLDSKEKIMAQRKSKTIHNLSREILSDFSGLKSGLVQATTDLHAEVYNKKDAVQASLEHLKAYREQAQKAAEARTKLGQLMSTTMSAKQQFEVTFTHGEVDVSLNGNIRQKRKVLDAPTVHPATNTKDISRKLDTAHRMVESLLGIISIDKEYHDLMKSLENARKLNEEAQARSGESLRLLLAENDPQAMDWLNQPTMPDPFEVDFEASAKPSLLALSEDQYQNPRPTAAPNPRVSPKRANVSSRAQPGVQSPSSRSYRQQQSRSPTHAQSQSHDRRQGQGDLSSKRKPLQQQREDGDHLDARQELQGQEQESRSPHPYSNAHEPLDEGSGPSSPDHDRTQHGAIASILEMEAEPKGTPPPYKDDIDPIEIPSLIGSRVNKYYATMPEWMWEIDLNGHLAPIIWDVQLDQFETQQVIIAPGEVLDIGAMTLTRDGLVHAIRRFSTQPRGFRVLLEGVPTSMNEGEIEQSLIGHPIVFTHVMRATDGANLGKVLVWFESLTAVQRAMDEVKELDGNPVTLSLPKDLGDAPASGSGVTGFINDDGDHLPFAGSFRDFCAAPGVMAEIRGIGPTTTEDSIVVALRACGFTSIKAVSVMDRESGPRAAVWLPTYEEVQKAGTRIHTIDGHSVKVITRRPQQRPVAKVTVNGLAPDISDTGLKNAFMEWGNVEAVVVDRHGNGMSHGTGNVWLSTESEARRVCENLVIEGADLKLSYTVEQAPPAPQKPVQQPPKKVNTVLFGSEALQDPNNAHSLTSSPRKRTQRDALCHDPSHRHHAKLQQEFQRQITRIKGFYDHKVNALEEELNALREQMEMLLERQRRDERAQGIKASKGPSNPNIDSDAYVRYGTATQHDPAEPIYLPTHITPYKGPRPRTVQERQKLDARASILRSALPKES